MSKYRLEIKDLETGNFRVVGTDDRERALRIYERYCCEGNEVEFWEDDKLKFWYC